MNLWCGPARYFFHKKKSLFFQNYFPVTVNALTSKKMLKKSVMLVFLGPKWPWENFWVFRKKSKKSEKMRFFRKKAYGLKSVFAQSRVIIRRKKSYLLGPKKNVKKKRFSFFETFFLKWKLDIYFCPFLKLKKKFWKRKNFPFSPFHWKYIKKIP